MYEERYQERHLCRVERASKAARKNRTQSPVIARVNCMSSRHTVSVLNGRLILHNHKPEDAGEIEVLRLLDPNLRCRCFEIRLWWQWYLSQDSYRSYWDLSDEHPWLSEVFENRSSRELTPGLMLSMLPKDLRPAVKEARKIQISRRNRDRIFIVGPGEKDVPSWALKGGFVTRSRRKIGDRYDQWSRSREIRKFTAKKMLRTLGAPKDSRAYSYFDGPREAMTWLKGIAKTEYAEVLARHNLIPIEVPCRSSWPPGIDYPPAVKAFQYNASNGSIATIWCCLTRNAFGELQYHARPF